MNETWPGPIFRTQLELRSTHCVAHLFGELDRCTSPQLLALEQPVLELGGCLVLDLRHLTFIDVGGINAFLHLDRALPSFAVTSPTRLVAKVLSITGTEHLLAGEFPTTPPSPPHRPHRATARPSPNRRRTTHS